MAEPLKNLYNDQFFNELCDVMQQCIPEFTKKKFLKLVLDPEWKQSELKQQAAELEMQALRAQMNPHFIFNCLSSINKFILKNETEAASDYLTRFSRLIRMVLINSQKSLITLEDELEMLRLYLDMERLRFKNSFEYNIHFKKYSGCRGNLSPAITFTTLL